MINILEYYCFEKLESIQKKCIILVSKYIQNCIYICTPVFTVSPFTVAKTWKQPKCLLIDEWIKKMWCIHNGILLSHKKE